MLISMKKRQISPQYIVSIKGITRLDYIYYSQENGVKIGDLATLQSIASSTINKGKFGPLSAAGIKIDMPQVRNMGTIGGNLCQAGPSQDTPPVLLVLDAKLKLVSLNGERLVPIDKFFIAPFQTALSETELLTEIQIPTPPPRSAGCYKWSTKITEVDETLVGVAVLISLDSTGGICNEIRIGVCSVAPTPIRTRRAEELLRGKRIEEKLVEEAAQVAADETRPRSRADYRRLMTRILVRQAINEAWQRVR